MLSAISGDCLVWASIIVLLPRRKLHPREFGSNALSNSASSPSPVVLKTRPPCSASSGSTTSRRIEGRRSAVPSPQLIRRSSGRSPGTIVQRLAILRPAEFLYAANFFCSLPAVACSALVDAQRAADLPIAFALGLHVGDLLVLRRVGSCACRAVRSYTCGSSSAAAHARRCIGMHASYTFLKWNRQRTAAAAAGCGHPIVIQGTIFNQAWIVINSRPADYRRCQVVLCVIAGADSFSVTLRRS